MDVWMIYTQDRESKKVVPFNRINKCNCIHKMRNKISYTRIYAKHVKGEEVPSDRPWGCINSLQLRLFFSLPLLAPLRNVQVVSSPTPLNDPQSVQKTTDSSQQLFGSFLVGTHAVKHMKWKRSHILKATGSPRVLFGVHQPRFFLGCGSQRVLHRACSPLSWRRTLPAQMS